MPRPHSDRFLKDLAHRMRVQRQSLIYGLFDDQDRLRYVGMSDGPAHLRFAGHLNAVNAKGNCPGVQELLKANSRIAVRVLEHCARSEARAMERRWIAWAVKNGCELVNRVGFRSRV